MGKIRNILKNRWLRFSVVSIIYILWFVVWSRSPWMILGEIVIFDLYITKYFQRFVWSKHLARKEKSRFYKSVSGWVEAIVFAVVAATLIRTYFVEMYVIPTGSMEKTLLVGDCIGVSKVAYGPKMPNTPLSVPFIHNTFPGSTKKSYLEWIKRPYKRLAGLDTIKRGDVVVFNYPEGDTVAVVNPQANYYQLVRAYGRENLMSQTEIMTHPVDKRDNYIKRAVAIHGDTLSIRNGVLWVNSKMVEPAPRSEMIYNVKGEKITVPFLESIGVDREEIAYSDTYRIWQMPLYEEQVEKLRKSPEVMTVQKVVFSQVEPDIFPHDTVRYGWSLDNFGPLWVPQKGATVKLTLDNLPLYHRIIKNYEGHSLEVRDSLIMIDGKAADSYTFAMNYYFMMGDNRHQSLDSRYWGFVPEDHIVGKAWFVLFNTDKRRSFPSNIRWERTFMSIK